MAEKIHFWRIKMRSTKKKSVKSLKTKTVYACGRIWSEDDLKSYRDYQNDFLIKTYRPFIFRMSKLKDADVIEFMESQDNLTGYIRNLIREDMKVKNFRMSDEARRKTELASLGDSLTEADVKALDEAIKECDEENR